MTFLSWAGPVHDLHFLVIFTICLILFTICLIKFEKVRESSRRLEEVGEGLRRFEKVRECSRKFEKVAENEGSLRFTKVLVTTITTFLLLFLL